MEEITIKARVIKKSCDINDINMLLIGNNMIMLTDDLLNSITIKNSVSDSRYDIIHNSDSLWIKDKNIGLEYKTYVI